MRNLTKYHAVVFDNRGNDNASAEDTEARLEVGQGQACFSDKLHLQRSSKPG